MDTAIETPTVKTHAEELMEDILRARKYVQDQADNYSKILPKVEGILSKLSADCTINAFGGTVWFTTRNRDDIGALMVLAPRWIKSAESEGIRYSAVVDGVDYWIEAKHGALPPTCKLVEREIVLPATPERTVKRMVVECAELV